MSGAATGPAALATRAPERPACRLLGPAALVLAGVLACGESPGESAVVEAAELSPELELLDALAREHPLPTGIWKGIGESTPIRRSLVARERALLAELDRERRPETLRRLGTLYTMAGETSRGVAYLTAALGEDLADGEAWMWLGANRLDEGDLEPARVLLEHAARLRPEDASVRTYLGLARLRAGDEDGARACFERAIELDPDSSDARVPLADLLEDSGDLAAARDELLAAREARPHYAPILFRLARLSRDLGDEEEARRFEHEHERITVLDDLALLYDTIPEAQRCAQLGIHYLESGRAAEALPEFERAMELDPEPNVEVNALMGRAWCLIELGRRAEAERAVDDFRRREPRHVELERMQERLAQLAPPAE
jgi:Flp pilus assembly protein TadD